MNTSFLTRVQDLLREMNCASLGNRPLDVTLIPPRLLYDLVLTAARCIVDQSAAANSDLVLERILMDTFPYDTTVWCKAANSWPPAGTSIKKHCWYRRCYSTVNKPAAWSRGVWRALDAPYQPIPALPGDLWRPMSNEEVKEFYK